MSSIEIKEIIKDAMETLEYIFKFNLMPSIESVTSQNSESRYNFLALPLGQVIDLPVSRIKTLEISAWWLF